MSSTNRSRLRDLHIADYYRTPINEIINFLDKFIIDEKVPVQKNIKILEPCAGGLIGKDKMSYVEALHNCGLGMHHGINTIDIRENSLADIKGNYLDMDCKNKYDMITTNPPFNIALDVIRKALDDVKDNGYVNYAIKIKLP